jgi:hypothetical protein
MSQDDCGAGYRIVIEDGSIDGRSPEEQQYIRDFLERLAATIPPERWEFLHALYEQHRPDADEQLKAHRLFWDPIDRRVWEASPSLQAQISLEKWLELSLPSNLTGFLFLVHQLRRSGMSKEEFADGLASAFTMRLPRELKVMLWDALP